MPVLCHHVSFGRPGRKPFTGSPRASRYGDLKDHRAKGTGLKLGAPGSVAGLGLFPPPEIYRLIKH